MAEPPRTPVDHAFQRPELLREALTHRSFGLPHNERLEFVGDAVLNCVMAVALYERFATLPEGDLSRLRAALVNRDTLARVAAQLGLDAHLRMGEGERKLGPARPSILADTLEALFGAVFLDAGFGPARVVIEATYGDLLRDADPALLGKDPKTRLQEWLQARRLPVPEYAVTLVTGEAHAQTFSVVCRIPALDIAAPGAGPSRRVAEQAAAVAAEQLVQTAHHGQVKA